MSQPSTSLRLGHSHCSELRRLNQWMYSLSFIRDGYRSVAYFCEWEKKVPRDAQFISGRVFVAAPIQRSARNLSAWWTSYLRHHQDDLMSLNVRRINYGQQDLSRVSTGYSQSVIITYSDMEMTQCRWPCAASDPWICHNSMCVNVIIKNFWTLKFLSRFYFILDFIWHWTSIKDVVAGHIRLWHS